MLDGMMRLLPDASVGHLGVYREEHELRPVTYFSRLPANLSEAQLEGTKLASVVLSGKGRRIGPRLADVQWGNTNLSVAGPKSVLALRADSGRTKESTKEL